MLLLERRPRPSCELAVGRGLEERGVARDLRLPRRRRASPAASRARRARPRPRSATGDLRPGAGRAAGARASSPCRCRARRRSSACSCSTTASRRRGFDERDLATLRTFAEPGDRRGRQRAAARRGAAGCRSPTASPACGTTATSPMTHRQGDRARRPLRPPAGAAACSTSTTSSCVNDALRPPARRRRPRRARRARVRAQVRDVDTARPLRRRGDRRRPARDRRGGRGAGRRAASAHAVRGRPVRRRRASRRSTSPCRVGVGRLPGARRDARRRCCARADEALYAAKRAGRDTWRLAAAPAPGARPRRAAGRPH